MDEGEGVLDVQKKYRFLRFSYEVFATFIYKVKFVIFTKKWQKH